MKVVTVLLSVGIIFMDDVVAQDGFYPPFPEDECGGRNDYGLTKVFNQCAQKFPTYDFIEILLEAINDEQVVEVIDLLMSQEFKHFVDEVGETDEWIEVMNVMCDHLHFSINYYLPMLLDFLKTVPIDRDTPKKRNGGVQGLYHDIKHILLEEGWQQIINDLIESDENVADAMNTIKGDIFKAFADTVVQMKEFKALKEKVIGFGVPLDCGIDHLRKMLGWSYSCLCIAECLNATIV